MQAAFAITSFIIMTVTGEARISSANVSAAQQASATSPAPNDPSDLVEVPFSDTSQDQERTEAKQVKSTRVQVKVNSDHEDVTIRDSVHAKTNHCIKQSRPYFPNEKLPTYFDFRFFLTLARLLCFASVFGVLVTTGNPKFKYLPVGFFVACFLFFLIYCQHEWVNHKSLPFLRKQPVIESQISLNAFYEVTITELNGIALHNYQTGVGFVQLSQGKIEFQAFNKKAIRVMLKAKRLSRLMLCLFFIASLCNCYFMASFTLGAGELFGLNI